MSYPLQTQPNMINAYAAGQAMRRNEEVMEREDEAYDEAQRLANTRFLAGSTKVLMDLYEKDPDQFYVAADELGTEGVRRGIIDPERWDPQLVTIEQVRDLHNSAMVGLAGKPVVAREPGQGTVPAKIAQYEYYRGNVAGNPENEAIWDQATQVDKGFKTVNIPMPDGSELTVNFDPQTGQGYDLTTGEQLIVRPGGGGEALVYHPETGLLGGGVPQNLQQSAAPEGFGRSQSPADRKRDELETQREFDMQKIVDSQLTAVQTSFRLQPMMQAALEGANAWNTAWGSLLKIVPGSSAKDLAAQIQTIKGNIGFDRLQRMRAESPTGGALGQVAIQELDALQNSLANLDQSQSTEQFKDNMRTVLMQYDAWTKAWGKAIMMEGTRDQKMRYYEAVPVGAWYYHPSGEYIQKKPR